MNRRQFLTGAIGVTAAHGFSEVELQARDNWVPFAGSQAYLSTFNAQLPGPAIEARPGDTVRIRLNNALSKETNLHYHGLHIPPTGNADNSFLSVPAGEPVTYEFDIPSDHPGGLFWYHPHMHGCVAEQVSRGLAGVIVVRGDIDQQPEFRDTPEFILVIQDFDISRSGQVIEPSAAEKSQGREGPLVTVNGSLNPIIAMQSAGWTRLRLLNASVSRFYRLRIEEHTFTIIGTDGGLIASPSEVDEILLVPGQRVDTLVWGRKDSGQFRLMNLPYNRTGMMMGRGQSNAASQVLSTLEYTGVASSSWSLPNRLATVEPLASPSRLRSFTFGMGMGMGMNSGGFTINGREFNPNRVDTRVSLNAIEDWDLINTSVMDHPFHIHTNAFQVVGSNGSVERAWRDVVLVKSGARVRIRMQFADFTGKAMYHCHILDHEDLGMMGVFEVSA